MPKMTLESGGLRDMKDTEKTGPVVDIQHARATLYFGGNVPLLKRLVTLAMQHRGVSVSGIVIACCAACIDTLERDMPKLRVFKLNGRNVEI